MEDKIVLNGTTYIKANVTPACNSNNERYVIIRTYSAGVFAGFLVEENKMHVVLKNARRLWHWEGAASLSQLAMEGVKVPDKCKFPCEVNRIKLEAIEIIDCTEQARKNIAEVPVWKR